MIEVRLKAPKEDKDTGRVSAKASRSRKVNLGDTQRQDLENKLKFMVDRWKEGASPLLRRLREVNDHMEGVSEDQSWPWPGASRVTMGLMAGMGRTLRGVFDRAVFPDQTPFAAKAKNRAQSKNRNELENVVNWLSMEHSNLVETLRDTPIPCFRDGTVPVMGEWERRVERVSDIKTYETVEAFQEDYPDAKAAGVSEDRYGEIIDQLSTYGEGAKISVEYSKDEVVRDAPKFTVIPLARFPFFPLSAEELKDCTIYGMQRFESETEFKMATQRGAYDKEAAMEALGGDTAGTHADQWGMSRESIEGLSREGDQVKRLEVYHLTLNWDLDEDDVPEKYKVWYEHLSGRILRIEHYHLRRNIDDVILFRFLRRDARLLGISMAEEGMDQFKMIDDIHRHRQNTRAITDSPAFIAPDSLKEEIDFGSEDMIFRPGITFWVSDKYLKEGFGPRQLPIRSFSNTAESLDEEQGVMRSLEFRLGPSQGLSGQESMVDPRAPATKHLSRIRQATLRLDDNIREWKRSIPAAIDLQNALYYQYADEKVPYGVPKGDKVEFKDALRDLFRLDEAGFDIKHQEISLSPEFEMEKAATVAAMAAQNPLALQMKPEIALHAYNDGILATRVADPERLMVDIPEKGTEGAGILQQGNRPAGEDLGAPTPNQQALEGVSSLLGGGVRRNGGTRVPS